MLQLTPWCVCLNFVASSWSEEKILFQHSRPWQMYQKSKGKRKLRKTAAAAAAPAGLSELQGVSFDTSKWNIMLLNHALFALLMKLSDISFSSSLDDDNNNNNSSAVMKKLNNQTPTIRTTIVKSGVDILKIKKKKNTKKSKMDSLFILCPFDRGLIKTRDFVLAWK